MEYRRTGSLWEGRYRSCITCEPRYILDCYRYIELAPVRRGLVGDPADYPWTSHRANAFGEDHKTLAPDDAFDSLGDSAKERQTTYRSFFVEPQDPAAVEQIRQATGSNRALGSEYMKVCLEARMGRRLSAGSPGRPRKLSPA